MAHSLHITRFIGGMLLLPQLFLSASVSAQLPSTPPCHVVILWEENQSYGDIMGCSCAPNINALADSAHAAIFTQFYAIEHPSQPNYLDLFSGSNQGVTDDNYPGAGGDNLTLPFTTPNLAAQLMAAGLTFTSYAEGLPAVGSDVQLLSTSAGEYYRKHNPCTNWSQTLGTGANTFPATVNQPFTSFPYSDFSTLPTVSFVAPNGTNDMHDYTIQDGDTWMYDSMDVFRAWTLDNNTLYIIIWDEDDDAHGNNIPVIFYGPMVKGGTYTENVNFWNLLHTVEQMYGLSYIGSAAGSGITSITDCWLNITDTSCSPVISTGVKNVANNNCLFTVMPNPATDVINFDCNTALNSQATITVFDVTGRVSGTYTMTGTHIQINTSAYTTGVYTYNVKSSNGGLLNQGKFVITHN